MQASQDENACHNQFSTTVFLRSVLECRNRMSDPGRYLDGHCMTYAYALANAMEYLGTHADLLFLMRHMREVTTGRLEEVAMSHCVAYNTSVAVDIDGAMADFRWKQAIPETELLGGTLFRNEWVSVKVRPDNLRALQMTAEQYEAEFNLEEAKALTSELITQYFMDVFSAPGSQKPGKGRFGVPAAKGRPFWN